MTIPTLSMSPDWNLQIKKEYNRMRFLFAFLILVSFSSGISYAQGTNQSSPQINNQAKQQDFQLELDSITRQLYSDRAKHENDHVQQETNRLIQESDRIKYESDLLSKKMRDDERDQKALDEFIDRTRINAENEKKRLAAIDVFEANAKLDVQLTSVKNFDFGFLLAILTFPVLMGFYFAKKTKEGGLMKYEQKFGVVVMIISFMLMLISLAISDYWNPQLDALQNILISLTIGIFENDMKDPTNFGNRYFFEIHTKFVLIFFTSTFALGYTIFLGIAPAWNRFRRIEQTNLTEAQHDSSTINHQ